MPQPTAHPSQVVPTTAVEAAEERLVRDVEELTAVVRAIASPIDVRRVEAHVAVDERRVRSLRALPCRRCASDAADVRRVLVAAYDRLAEAYAATGRDDRRTWAAARAAEERGALTLAA
ncbi:unannotated protein [freshwater metagenome]|uniref:Unannotated protein n=1 Tax=freshwater metagenome TaxID=449393 RepID=A0A6J7FDQ7_9ZZZZ|nr:hypothetical protein [Actinomycetota bacterium]